MFQQLVTDRGSESLFVQSEVYFGEDQGGDEKPERHDWDNTRGDMNENSNQTQTALWQGT